MKIVHFSDPHAGGPAEDLLAYIDKRWVGVFNYNFRRKFRHDMTKLENAVRYILDTKPDVAVCTGDLTSTGQPGEFELVRPILRPLRDSPIPLIYLPGNHDCYVKRPKCVKAVNEMVEYLTREDYRFGDLPVVREYAGVEFLLLNCSRPSNLLCSWGFVDPRDAEWAAHPRLALSDDRTPSDPAGAPPALRPAATARTAPEPSARPLALRTRPQALSRGG